MPKSLYRWPVFMFVYQLLEAQADYHRRSLAALEAAIPNIQVQQGDLSLKPQYIYIVKITFMVVYQLHNSQAALYSAADKCRRACRCLLDLNQVNSWLVSQVLYHSHHCCGTGNCIFQPQTPQCVYDERLLSPLWNPAAQISMKLHCLWLSPKLSCC